MGQEKHREAISATVAAGFLIHEADRRNREEWRDKVIEKRRRELEDVREQLYALYRLLEDEKLSAKAKINISEDIKRLEEKANDIHGGMYENIAEPPHVFFIWVENAWKFLTCQQNGCS